MLSGLIHSDSVQGETTGRNGSNHSFGAGEWMTNSTVSHDIPTFLGGAVSEHTPSTELL